MNHEYEQHLASSSTATAARARTTEPGQSSRSALLRIPGHPIISGLVQRKRCGTCGDDARAPAEPPADKASVGDLAAVQRNANEDPDADNIHRLAAEGISGTGSTLPFLDQIQRSFGNHDVGNIVAHIGGSATGACEQMAANAYATGDHVAFRGAPDLHTAAHEAAHVVQQRAGVQLLGGVGQIDDEYERNADQVADAVVAGKSAETLLGAPGRSSQASGLPKTSGLQPSSDEGTARALCPKCQRGDCECSGPYKNFDVQHSRAHDVQQVRRFGGRHPVQRDANPSLPGELPQPTTCGIIITPGDKFSPQWQCKNIPGIGSTPPLPIDPRKIPPYIKAQIGKMLPKPQGPNPPTIPIFILAPDDLLRTICGLNPQTCLLTKSPDKPPLRFDVQLDTVRVLFNQGRPKVDDVPVRAITSDGLERLNSVIERLKADRRLNVHLIGNASMEGAEDVNLVVSTRRVELVFRMLEDAGRSLQVFTPLSTFDSAAAGCNLVGMGKFSCGELKANQDAIEPRDRNVLITFFRFAQLESKPDSPVGFPPGTPSRPSFGLPPGPF